MELVRESIKLAFGSQNHSHSRGSQNHFWESLKLTIEPQNVAIGSQIVSSGSANGDLES